MDIYSEIRRNMVETMQASLKSIRQLLGYGVQEFADLIGLSRQSINNLENRKIRMSSTQFVAICAIIDYNIAKQREIVPTIRSVLSSNAADPERNPFFETNPDDVEFVKQWLSCFPSGGQLLNIDGPFHFADRADLVEELASRYKIFLDETALAIEGLAERLRTLTDAMRLSGNKYIIPAKSLEFLQESVSLESESVPAPDIRSGIRAFIELQREGVIDIRGEETDTTVISTLVSVFARFKHLNRMALITENEKLARQVFALNNDDIGGFPILVFRSHCDSFIPWEIEDGIIVDPDREGEEVPSSGDYERSSKDSRVDEILGGDDTGTASEHIFFGWDAI